MWFSRPQNLWEKIPSCPTPPKKTPHLQMMQQLFSAMYFDIKSTLLCCPNIFQVPQASLFTLSKSIKESEKKQTRLWQPSRLQQHLKAVSRQGGNFRLWDMICQRGSFCLSDWQWERQQCWPLNWIIWSSTTGHVSQAAPFFWKWLFEPGCRHRQACLCWFFSGSV